MNQRRPDRQILIRRIVCSGRHDQKSGEIRRDLRGLVRRQRLQFQRQSVVRHPFRHPVKLQKRVAEIDMREVGDVPAAVAFQAAREYPIASSVRPASTRVSPSRRCPSGESGASAR